VLYFHPRKHEYDTVSATTLLRLRYPAKLYRDFNLLILPRGGAPSKRFFALLPNADT
jgi:hypothetical protein